MQDQRIDAYLDAHRQQFEDDLFELLRFASVSADPQYSQEVRQAAENCRGQFDALGLAPELIETSGHPLVYAESPPVPGAPVALVYGHYDVQPPEPLDEWISPPFEPTVRDGNVYARGATDDKGQMLTHVKSVEAWIQTVGKLPLQVKFLIEGEEEVGSEHLEPFVAENRERLACDCVVISDCCQFARGLPAITYGLRGIMYFEVFLRGPRQDLHSGTFGGGVTNPAGALVAMLAALKDERGRVRVPGFYDDVVPLTEDERERFAALPFDEQEYAESLGIPEVHGEEGYTTKERVWGRPTCDVNGIYGGYQGKGAKTVLPSWAGAKISMRLVPNQKPDEIGRRFEEYAKSLAPAGVTVDARYIHGAPAVLINTDGPLVEAAMAAQQDVFGAEPVLIREGGSIPIVGTFNEVLGVPVILMGFGFSDDGLHSPNEKFNIGQFYNGIRTIVRLLDRLG
jgi:acetylornithine deacetylase/succinyl-diaminopimelate desuccinylase-like protein